MNARKFRLAASFLSLSLFLVLASACGSFTGPGGGGSNAEPADAGEHATLYARIDKALDDAYAELGEPPVDWDNMVRVKDRAFEELTSESAEPMWGASWSLSALSDGVAIHVNVEGEEKSGDWRP